MRKRYDVLVPGCGAGHDAFGLSSSCEDLSVAGVDVAGDAIDAEKWRANADQGFEKAGGKTGPHPHFYTADFLGWHQANNADKCVACSTVFFSLSLSLSILGIYCFLHLFFSH